MIYWLYRLLAKLPLPALYRLADLAAWLLGSVFGYRRNIVDSNLVRAFPELSADERASIRKWFYRGLADVTVETIAGSRMPQNAFPGHVTISNPEVLHQLSNNGEQSVVVLTLHLGNWEWMLHRASSEYAMDQAFIYKRLHSSDADRFTLEARQRFGAEPIELRDTSKNMVRNRRRPRLIFLLADQSPGKRERVHVTEFLNQPTAFFAGAAALARVTGFPMAFAACRRTQRGHYQIDLAAIAQDPKQIPEPELMETYVRLAESRIRQAPDEWLWTNRRWKHQPDATAGSAADGEPSKSSQSNPSD